MSILNLTQHQATAEQIEAGVIEPSDKAEIQSLLTFQALPSKAELVSNAEAIALIARASGCDTAMIGGAPFFMSVLENALRGVGVKPVYAFSERVSVESMQDDGSVIKKNVFRHVGFVEA